MNSRSPTPFHGVSIVLTDPARADVAIELAATAIALGESAALHLRDDAVVLVRDSAAALRQAGHDGVELTYCPTSAADRAMEMHDFPEAAEASGLVSLYAGLGTRRLVVI